MGKIKNLVYSLLTVATISGTIGGTEGGFNPLSVKKTSPSYGINIGVITEYHPGARHYGLDLSCVREMFGGTINGGAFSIINATSVKKGDKPQASTINGLEASLIFNGITSKESIKETVNGVQASLIYNEGQGKNVQIGIYNENDKRSSLGINF